MTWTVAIGVDTHRERHSACALDRLGRPLGSLELAADPGGYRRLLAWGRSLGEPAFALEGSGSYGSGLARALSEAGTSVYECERPTRRDRRRGKSDALDATAAARKLLAGEGLALLRGFGAREQLRELLLERRSAQRARTAALNQLHALVIAAQRGTTLRRLGRRVLLLGGELAAVDRELAQLVGELAPSLLEEYGVGPVCAAQLLVSSGEPARMRSEAAFAALGGTSPVDASSGRQQRHRLNRGGDRQLNCALHVIALNRKRGHDATRAYYERLLARGKSKREAMRCLKRMLARHFYGRLRTIETLARVEAAA